MVLIPAETLVWRVLGVDHSNLRSVNHLTKKYGVIDFDPNSLDS